MFDNVYKKQCRLWIPNFLCMFFSKIQLIFLWICLDNDMKELIKLNFLQLYCCLIFVIASFVSRKNFSNYSTFNCYLKGRVHCFSMLVVMNKCFLLNLEKKFGAHLSCRF